MQYKGYVYKPSYDRDSDGFNKISHEIHDKMQTQFAKVQFGLGISHLIDKHLTKSS